MAAYALVCSLLYSSAEKAVNALAEAYIQARGDYGQAAECFDCVYQTVVSRYVALGLPNFSGKRGACLFDSAIAFFVEKKSWADSIAVGSVTPEEMENMVRCSGDGVGGVLKEIRLPNGSKSATKRPRRLGPKDAQEMKKAMPSSDMASG